MEDINAKLQASEFNFQMQINVHNTKTLNKSSENERGMIQKELQKQFTELGNYFKTLIKEIEAEKLKELMVSYGEIDEDQEKQINELSSQIAQLHKEEKYEEIVKKTEEVEEIKKILQDCRDKLVKPKGKFDLEEEFETIKENVEKSLEKSLEKVKYGSLPHKFWKLANMKNGRGNRQYGLSGIDFRVEIGVANFPVPSGKALGTRYYTGADMDYSAQYAFRGKTGAREYKQCWRTKESCDDPFIQYEFDEPISVVELALAPIKSYTEDSPTEFTLWYSEDGTNWEIEKEFKDVKGYKSDEWIVLDLE